MGLYLGIMKNIQGSAGRPVQQRQRVKEGGRRPAPVGRPLVAAAVIAINAGKALHRRQHLAGILAPDAFRLPQQQHSGQRCGGAPGRPVVQRALKVNPHPEAVAAASGAYNAPQRFLPDAQRQAAAHLIQPAPHHPIEHCHERACFAGKKVPGRIRPIGQRVGHEAVMAAVGRQRPACFLANQPRAVDQRVQEPALPLHAFRNHQVDHRGAPVKVIPFIAAAVAGTHKIHIPGCQQAGPGILKPGLAAPHHLLLYRLLQRRPGCPVLIGRIEHKIPGRQQMLRQKSVVKAFKHRPSPLSGRAGCVQPWRYTPLCG